MIKMVKKQLKHLVNNINLIKEYYNDYKTYLKWNYNNPKVKTKAAYEAKILRQTHMIEKGLSLSSPRKGFGIPKIFTLLDFLEEYLREGYNPEDIPFQNALSLIESYLEYQKRLGYTNLDLEEKFMSFQKYRTKDVCAGIETETKDHLKELQNSSYPEFFRSRHSIRQFSSKAVNPEDVQKAIQLAQKAPTACNRQASKVYMYLDPRVNSELGDLIAGNTGFQDEVNNYLVITADSSAFYDSFERNQLYVEAGIFTMALVESLHYYDIASCVLQNGEFKNKNKQFKQICKNIPENERIVLFIAIGYYKDQFTYAVSKRKKIDDVFILSE